MQAQAIPHRPRVELLSDHPIARDLDDVLISRRSIAYAHACNLRALLGMPRHLTATLLDLYHHAAADHDLAAAHSHPTL
jgi:hypothetical protein